MDNELTNELSNSTNELLTETKDLDGNSMMEIFGIDSNDRVYYDGSADQYKGHKRMATFTIGINKDLLDGPVNQVGFKGTDNNEPLQIFVDSSAEYGNGLWDIDFELYVNMMGETCHQIKGAFFVETINSTNYWLKDKNSNDFEFGSDSCLTLNDFC